VRFFAAGLRVTGFVFFVTTFAFGFVAISLRTNSTTAVYYCLYFEAITTTRLSFSEYLQ
jgi:hypothetical protein